MEGSSLSKKAIKILLVDDEPEILEILSDTIKRMRNNICVATRTGAKGAIDYFIRDGEVDVIVTDLRMPDESGLDLIKELRTKNNSNVPILVFSGSFSDIDEAEIATCEISNVVSEDRFRPTVFVCKTDTKKIVSELGKILDMIERNLLPSRRNS